VFSVERGDRITGAAYLPRAQSKSRTATIVARGVAANPAPSPSDSAIAPESQRNHWRLFDPCVAA
ncbi:MAG: hypothetical protein V3T00_07245, partial [bacterium]